MTKSGNEERSIKMKKTKEEIRLQQAKKKAITEDICYVLITIFFLCMAVCGIMALYRMITFVPDWS